MKTSIVWLRRDLRLSNNPALHRALSNSERVILLYIHAPQESAPWQPGAASRWWLHHSLIGLQQSVEKRGGQLLIHRGPTISTLLHLCQKLNAGAVYWNKAYTPEEINLEQDLSDQLAEHHIQHHTFHGSLLHPPGSILNKEGNPYRVFTAFWNASQRLQLQHTMFPAPQRLFDCELESEPLDALELLPMIGWDTGLRQHWQPGEKYALRQLERLCDELVNDYTRQRDYPAINGTARLSPHLAFGEITPQQIIETLRNSFMSGAVHGGASEAMIRQLGWREFAYHTLYHFPQSTQQVLNRRFEHFPWQNAPSLLEAWQKGRTGIPIIDAGMRELWYSGWMHNRVRMIVASFLCKNGLVPWQEGARWFWDTLVDADLAINSLNWQWVAGTGLDAAPYFRIFNPITQSHKFDADGRYIRRWLPELTSLPNKHIHAPWLAPASVLQACKLNIGIDYPEPALDLKETRKQALACFKGSQAIHKGKVLDINP